MKQCHLCLMPRPNEDWPCQICEWEDFSLPDEEIPEDFVLRMVGENRLDVAYRALEDLVSKGEETAETCLRLAWVAFAVEDYRAVETWCHEAERLEAGSAEPHLIVGLVHRLHEHWPEALEEFEAGLKKRTLSPARQALLSRLRAESAARIPEW